MQNRSIRAHVALILAVVTLITACGAPSGVSPDFDELSLSEASEAPTNGKTQEESDQSSLKDGSVVAGAVVLTAGLIALVPWDKVGSSIGDILKPSRVRRRRAAQRAAAQFADAVQKQAEAEAAARQAPRRGSLAPPSKRWRTT